MKLQHNVYVYLVYVCIVIVLVVIINEVIQAINRQIDRRNIYKQAHTRANNIKRPLLVYGDPYYGKGSRFLNLFMDGYGCGDETVDLTGSPLCENGVKSDMLKHLKTKQPNSQVIFVSCVLEYLDDIEEVFDEMKRVAGSIENIYVVTVNELSLSAYFYQEDDYSSKHIIYAHPKYNDLYYK